MPQTGGDPRFDGMADQKAVKVGKWFRLEHMGHIQFGTADDYVEASAAGKRNLMIYAQQSGAYADDSQVVRVDFKSYGSTTASTTGGAEGDVIWSRFQAHATISGGASAGFFSVRITDQYPASNFGLLAALRGWLTVEAATRSWEGGTMCAIDATLNIKAGNVKGSSVTSIFRANDQGAVKGDYLLDSLAVADATDGIWDADTGAVGTPLGYYKVRTAAGDGYIVVYDGHS